MKKITALAVSCISLFFWSEILFSAQLNTPNGSVFVDKGEIRISRDGKAVIDLNAIKFNYERADEWKVSHADENKIILTGTFPASADFYRHVDDSEKRRVELSISREENGFRFHAEPEWGRQVTLEFDYLGDHFFGLSEPLQPDNQLSPDLTHSSVAVDINSKGASLRENYAAPIPHSI